MSNEELLLKPERLHTVSAEGQRAWKRPGLFRSSPEPETPDASSTLQTCSATFNRRSPICCPASPPDFLPPSQIQFHERRRKFGGNHRRAGADGNSDELKPDGLFWGFLKLLRAELRSITYGAGMHVGEPGTSAEPPQAAPTSAPHVCVHAVKGSRLLASEI